MEALLETFSHHPSALGPSWIDANHLLDTLGLIGLLAIVFVESGMLVGFFLPGDSLLFTAGMFSSKGMLADIWVLCILIPLVAIAGDQVGFAVGRKFGPPIFDRPDSRFFRREYVERSHRFFEKYGARTILLARFVPVVRAFAPVMAGTSGMAYRTFVTYNVIGGILWGVGVTLLGYHLGQIAFIEKNIEFILIAVVLASVVPIYFELRRAAAEPA